MSEHDGYIFSVILAVSICLSQVQHLPSIEVSFFVRCRLLNLYSGLYPCHAYMYDCRQDGAGKL